MRKKSSYGPSLRITLLNIKSVLLILSWALLAFVILVLINSYFQVKIIQIEGDVPVKKIKGLENLKNKNILLLSDGLIIGSLEDNNPEIEIVEIERVEPNKLILKLKLIEPIAALKLNQGYAYLSSDGRLLKKRKTPGKLPVINFYQQFDYYQFSPGNNLNYEEIAMTLLFLQKVHDLKLQVKNIDIVGLNMIIFNLSKQSSESGGKKIYFSAEKDEAKQAFEFETLVRQFKIEAKDFKILDLRFDKPIVRF